MEYPLADRLSRIEESTTVAMNVRAQALRAEGKPVLNLSVGEPDFDTPDFIKEATIEALKRGETRYTAPEGTKALREAIAHKFQRDNALTYDPAQIIVSSGVKHSLFNLCQATLNAGDEVIIPAPYWVSYPALVALSDGVSVIAHTTAEQHFKLQPDILEAAITPRTKWLFLNSPSNPTGVMYTRADWLALGEVLKRHPHVWIATDDIYEYISWGSEPFSNILNICPEFIDRTVVLNGVSKSYAMTGFRIGYAAGPKPVIQAMKKLQSQNTNNPNSLAQAATIAALQEPRARYMPMVESFHTRYQTFSQALATVPGLQVPPAQGAFYLFVDVTAAMQQLHMPDDIAFATYLLEKTYIATVPGSAFGMPGYVRFSYATHQTVLDETVSRLKTLLSR